MDSPDNLREQVNSWSKSLDTEQVFDRSKAISVALMSGDAPAPVFWERVTYPQLPHPRGVLGLDAFYQVRPYRIAIIDLGGLSGINYRKLARKVNSLQTTFRYVVVSPAVTDLGIKDELHVYTYNRLFSLIKSHLEGTECKFGVGIIHERLEKDAFNHHSVDERVGVITVRDYEEYIPFGRSKEQYVTYLLICETLCLIGGVDFEHQENRNCLFDWCIEKPHFRQCMEFAIIDKFCTARLTREGCFTQNEITDAHKILDYTARANINEIAKEALSNPFTNLFIGGLTVNLLSSYIYNLPNPWPSMFTSILILGIILSVIVPVFIKHFRRIQSLRR